MKILFITGLHPTQANPMSAIFITRRIKKLQESGIDYDLFFFSERMSWFARLLKRLLKRPSFKEKRTVGVGDVRYDPLPVAISIWDMVFYHRRIGRVLASAVKERVNLKEYDLVHAHWVYPHGYIAALLKMETGIPCVISAHGSDIHTNPYKNPNSISPIVFALESADRVIFNNHRLLDTAKKLGYSGANSVVIPNGVDAALFSPLEKREARAMLGLPPLTARLVGFVGGLKRVKRADRLPEIFKEIAELDDEIKFVVIGDGKLRQDIEKRCEHYQLETIFVGRIEPDEIPAWMSALDVLILPSRREGFPNVCLEAQSCGCPVVGSIAGGIPEAIGNGGLIVDDTGGDFEKDFSRAVIRLLEKPLPREQLRKRALAFDWGQVIKKQIQVYENVLKKGAL